MTGVAWHEVDTTADHGAVRRWAPTYPGIAIVRHRRRAVVPAVARLWRRWHVARPVWSDRLITAAAAITMLLCGAVAAGAMA